MEQPDTQAELCQWPPQVAVVLEKTQNDDRLIAALRAELAGMRKHAGRWVCTWAAI